MLGRHLPPPFLPLELTLCVLSRLSEIFSLIYCIQISFSCTVMVEMKCLVPSLSYASVFKLFNFPSINELLTSLNQQYFLHWVQYSLKILSFPGNQVFVACYRMKYRLSQLVNIQAIRQRMEHIISSSFSLSVSMELENSHLLLYA